MAAVLDLDYLRDLREGIGATTFAELAARAPHSFAEALEPLHQAWLGGDHAGIEEHAHRLKGAAASIGCPLLAEAALRIMVNPGSDACAIDTLQDLAAQATTALRRFVAEQD